MTTPSRMTRTLAERSIDALRDVAAGDGADLG